MAASCEAAVDGERVRALQLLLQPDPEPLVDGDPLPPLWHWAALPRWGDPADTGPDGHPVRPEGLAGTPVRRMFAGGEVEFAASLRIGDRVAHSTALTSVQQKSGRSGDFTLATFASQVTTSAGDVVLTERQDVVYTSPSGSTPEAPAGALPVVGAPLRARDDGSVELRTDPTILLRFSALTANPHRIHYDLAYAREVEGLPGLLVHGPLINLALAGLVTGRARRIRHRNLSPLFVGQTAVLTANQTTPEIGPAEVTAEATGPDGRTTSRVVVELEVDDRKDSA